jgi:hypothetical protein
MNQPERLAQLPFLKAEIGFTPATHLRTKHEHTREMPSSTGSE